MSDEVRYNDMVANYLSPYPKDVQGLDNTSYFYYRTQLYLKLFSVFKFNNLPDSWDLEYLLNYLFPVGYLIAIKSSYGNLLLKGSAHGINVYNKPTEVVIANPAIPESLTGTIGKDCELLYFNRVHGSYKGVESLITRYAVLLSQCDGSINSTLINSRVAHVFKGSTDSEIATMKKAVDKVTSGSPFLFIKSGNADLFANNSNHDFLNVKNTYIGNELFQTKRTIMNEFLTEIGINNANTDKRERLNTAEVNANNSEKNTIVNYWVDTMNQCFKRINKMFGFNVSVELNEEVMKGSEPDVNDPLVRTL